MNNDELPQPLLIDANGRALYVCLKCEEYFSSNGKGNRFCHKCTHKNNGLSRRAVCTVKGLSEIAELLDNNAT